MKLCVELNCAPNQNTFCYKILEICGQINSEKYETDPSTRIETQNTEKQVPPNWIEKQNTDYQNAIEPSITKQMLTQEDKIDVELLKKIIIEKKTTLQFLRNRYWKKWK